MQHSKVSPQPLQSAEHPAVPPEREIPEAWQRHISLLGLPRGGLQAFRSLDESWLYEKSSSWPQGVERRLHRYMHTTDLYEVTEVKGAGFSKVVDLFIAASGLPTRNLVREIVFARCRSLINTSSKVWEKDGVIERHSSVWRKSAGFQTLWDAEVEKVNRSKSCLKQAPSDVDTESYLNMSRRSSSTTNRRMSEDSVSAKRHAEEEQQSSIEASKRARRSSSHLAQDDSGDFVMVSSSNRRKRTTTDINIEEGLRLSYDDSKPPVGRIYPDCEISEEVAQKAVDVWNSLQFSRKVAGTTRLETSESDLGRERDSNSPTQSENTSSVEGNRASAPSPRESIGSGAPGSGWSSTRESDHARAAVVRTPGSESHADTSSISRRSTPQAQTDFSHPTSGRVPSNGQQRTPLPSRREQSPSQIAVTASRPILIPSPEISRSWPSTNSDQHELTEQSGWGEAAQPRDSGNTQDTQKATASSWSISDSMSHCRPSEEPHGCDPASSPLFERFPKLSRSPVTSSASPTTATVPNNVSTRDPGPFTTFPSSFSLLTPESVQQKKKRGRKPAAPNPELPRRDPSVGVPQMEVNKPARFFPEYGLPRQTTVPDSETQQTSRSAQSGLPATPVSRGFYQTMLPPRPTTTPPPVPPAYNSESYQPPALVFTLENKVSSELKTSDIQTFVDKFKRNTRAIITGFGDSNNAHDIDFIMFQSLQLFYQWYSDNTGITEIGALRFELIDVHWQQERSFVVPEGSLTCFRTLKQYIWDLCWIAMDMNRALGIFRVTMSEFPPRAESSLAGNKSASRWRPAKSNTPSRFVSTPKSQSILVVPTGVPSAFRSHSQSSPPSHPLSILPPPPPLRSTHHTSNSIESNLSPPNNLRPSPQSPTLSLYQNGSCSKESLPQPHHGENEGRNTVQIQHQSLYASSDSRRTGWEQSMMKDFARSLKLPDAEIMNEESTVRDQLPYKTGAEVCAVVIDRMSGTGLVTVTGKGYITLSITTGPDEIGERFKEVTIQPKQTCMLHGGAVVLYIKRAPGPPPLQSALPIVEAEERYGRAGRPPGSIYDQGINHALVQERYPDMHPLPLSLTLPSQHNKYPQIHNREDSQPNTNPSNPTIKIRVQIDGSGHFSPPFDKSVLHPKITTSEFFTWFASQSRNSPPRPCQLKFTFKDAMPVPQATEITVGNEDHFNYMRKDIKSQCEKAWRFMPELTEFVVLITVPGWVSPGFEEEEDW